MNEIYRIWSNCALFFNACFSYFAFKSTHFAQVLENFVQQACVCTSATFRSSVNGYTGSVNKWGGKVSRGVKIFNQLATWSVESMETSLPPRQ